jgi:hypothetical protein
MAGSDHAGMTKPRKLPDYFVKVHKPGAKPIKCLRHSDSRLPSPAHRDRGRGEGRYPFVAPAVRPSIMKRWTKTKITSSGAITKIAAASTIPQSVLVAS